MNNYSKVLKKWVRRIDKIRFAPIEVFVFHAVSDVFDERLNMRVDWSSTQEFKQLILDYQNKYTFIPLEDSYRKLSRNWFRRKRYAVLTCDDGFASILDILPFLEDRNIPITLFVNPCYLDGISVRQGYSSSPKYISRDELFALQSSNVTIGMHGYEHNDATKLTKEGFSESVDKCVKELSAHPRYIPFFAYTWGNYSEQTQQVLKQKHIVPVLTDGESNFRYRNGIGRKPIDSYYLSKKK